MVRPNGVIGTADGKILYVADHGGGKTYCYNINPDGTLSNKKLFAQQGSDGMTIDAKGNIYLTGDDVSIYEPTGKKIASISVPEKPSNVQFLKSPAMSVSAAGIEIRCLLPREAQFILYQCWLKGCKKTPLGHLPHGKSPFAGVCTFCRAKSNLFNSAAVNLQYHLYLFKIVRMVGGCLYNSTRHKAAKKLFHISLAE
jgi:hypothetical protein